MNTKSLAITLALITSANLCAIPTTAAPTISESDFTKSEIENLKTSISRINSRIPQELDPCEIADLMGNETPNAFCDFRIVTNARVSNLTEVTVGEDAFILEDWGYYSETYTSYVLFNTRGTDTITDDIIIGIYETPTDDDSAELALYESIYNDMWSLR